MSTTEFFPQNNSIVRPATVDEVALYTKPKKSTIHPRSTGPAVNRVVFDDDADNGPAVAIGGVAEPLIIPTPTLKSFPPLTISSATLLVKMTARDEMNTDVADDEHIRCLEVRFD